jgi:ADP-ribose pyrophosphatase
VSESFFMVKAHGLTRVSAGGGVEGENITVHRVKIDQIGDFIAARRDDGCAIDAKLLMLVPGLLT